MAHTQRTFLRAKIHRATVTGANLEYTGSIAVCRRLLALANIRPFEKVDVNSVTNGKHWETYVIESDAPGEITLHGPPAHFFNPGDKIVINVWEQTDNIDLVAPKVLYVDEHNMPVKMTQHDFTGDCVRTSEF